MNIPSSTMVGASSRPASSRSFSRACRAPRGRCETRTGDSVTSTRVAASAPPAIGFFTLASPVDGLELTGRPLHGVLGPHALGGLGVHVGEDVLGIDLAGLGDGRSLVADDPRG